MKKLLLILALFCTSVNANAQTFKIGVIDADKIMQEAKIAKLAQQKIESEAKKRQSELEVIAKKGRTALEKLQKEGASLSQSEQDKRRKELDDIDNTFRAKQSQFQEEIANIRNTEFSNVVTNTNAVIKTIASQEKFDLILQDAVYVNPELDITNKILNVLNK